MSGGDATAARRDAKRQAERLAEKLDYLADRIRLHAARLGSAPAVGRETSAIVADIISEYGQPNVAPILWALVRDLPLTAGELS